MDLLYILSVSVMFVFKNADHFVLYIYNTLCGLLPTYLWPDKTHISIIKMIHNYILYWIQFAFYSTCGHVWSPNPKTNSLHFLLQIQVICVYLGVISHTLFRTMKHSICMHAWIWLFPLLSISIKYHLIWVVGLSSCSVSCYFNAFYHHSIIYVYACVIYSL